MDSTTLSTTNLPLLEFTLERHAYTDLSSTLLIGVQHLLPTTYFLFQAFIELGLPPQNLLMLGKCYSTDPHVFEKLKQKKIGVCEKSANFDSHAPYDKQFDEKLDWFLEEILSKFDFNEYARIILLDDGGSLLKKIKNKKISIPNVIAIEQTSSGYSRTKGLELPFSVINLARCWAKLELESPLILKSAMEALVKSIDKKAAKREEILILGNGTLGSLFKKKLQGKHNVTSYDQNPEKSDYKEAEFPGALEKATVIIGCTGETSLSHHFHKFLSEGTILASFSSSDREFDAYKLRSFLPLTHICHQDLSINKVELLNSGFPINFLPGSDFIDPVDFQLTRALILGSVIQASNFPLEKRGYYPLSDKIQNEIVSEYKKERESL